MMLEIDGPGFTFRPNMRTASFNEMKDDDFYHEMVNHCDFCEEELSMSDTHIFDLGNTPTAEMLDEQCGLFFYLCLSCESSLNDQAAFLGKERFSLFQELLIEKHLMEPDGTSEAVVLEETF